MYLVTTLCLCFCVISESLSSSRPRRSVLGGYSSVVGKSVRVAGVRRGPPTSECMTQHPGPATPSYTGESNSFAYDVGIPAIHRKPRPRACNCPPHAAGQHVNGYRPSTCCQMQQWPSTTRRTMPPWPTARTPPLCTTCRTLPPCKRCQTLPPCTRCQQTLPPLCTTCRTLPPCTTCRTLPPCTTCRTLPPCTTCRTLSPCTTCRTLPPCIKCQTTRPLLVVRVEIPERPCYTPMPCDTRSAHCGGYDNALSDNKPPSRIIYHLPVTTTRRPCRQPTKCPCTSMIPAMQPCDCKLRG